MIIHHACIHSLQALRSLHAMHCCPFCFCGLEFNHSFQYDSVYCVAPRHGVTSVMKPNPLLHVSFPPTRRPLSFSALVPRAIRPVFCVSHSDWLRFDNPIKSTSRSSSNSYSHTYNGITVQIAVNLQSSPV